MTIQIFSPFAGSPIGPGVLVWWNVISIPDVPVGSHWTIEVFDRPASNEVPFGRYTFPAESPVPSARSFMFGDPAIPQMPTVGQRVDAEEASDVDLRIRLLNPNATQVLDELIYPALWTASHQYLLFPKIGSGTGTVAADVAKILAAVTTSWGSGGALNSLIDFVAHPTLNLVQPTRIDPPRTGKGRLIRPGIPGQDFGVNAFGLTWTITQLPEGIGKIDGNPLTWRPRILQLTTIHTLADGTEWITEEATMSINQFVWRWSEPLPTYIDYAIVPGGTIQFHWLTGRTTLPLKNQSDELASGSR